MISFELGGCKLTDEVENYMGRIGVKGGRDGESGNENSAMCERRECDNESHCHEAAMDTCHVSTLGNLWELLAL